MADNSNESSGFDEHFEAVRIVGREKAIVLFVVSVSAHHVIDCLLSCTCPLSKFRGGGTRRVKHGYPHHDKANGAWSWRVTLTQGCGLKRYDCI
jgi:hypothetical protein